MIISNPIPKQVTKAPKLGAAVSSLPLHEAAVPLNTTLVADFMAQHALDEWNNSMSLVRYHRLHGDRTLVAHFLKESAEFRRVYIAFAKA
ncbi:hypothetical protein ABT56_20240, partial [Photobacterium aquae]